MKERIKKIILNKNLYYFIMITFVFFGTFAKMEYATDTYCTLAFSIRETITQFAALGRYIVILFLGILKLIKLKPESIYFISFALSLVCMIISLFKVYNMIMEDVKDNILRIIIPVLIILNIFSIELFLFIEKGVMLFSILACVLAAEKMKKWLENKQKRYIIQACIYMLIANFSYQGVIGIFVAISLIYILKYSKNIKDFIVNNIAVACTYGIPTIIDYILVKFTVRGDRVNGEIILSESIKKIMANTRKNDK